MNLKKLKGKGLIIHHWDADGISSASLLLQNLSHNGIINKTPKLGNFFLTKKELNEYSEFDYIIILDMSLPKNDILTLNEKSTIFIFDHHLGQEITQVFHHNPIIKGENPEKYPSTSWIVNDFLGNDINLITLIGIIGDHEKRIEKNNIFFKIITKFCNENKTSINEILKMTFLIDSNYKIGDKIAVEKAPHVLLKYKSLKDILKNEKWNNNLSILEKEINLQLNKPVEERKNIIIKKINSPYNIISTLTRKIAWESQKDILVVNNGFSKESDQIYIRSNKNLENLISNGKSLGYRCGGKKEVMGAVVTKDKTDFFVKLILEYLS